MWKEMDDWMAWRRRLHEIMTGQSWLCVCVSQLNSFSIRTGEVEGYRYCVALRIVSLPLYHTPSRSRPQTESGGPGLFHSWLWQRNGARGPLLLLIRADAWLSCMPAAQPNRDYVPGWWRQKKKKRSLLRSLFLHTFGEFEFEFEKTWITEILHTRYSWRPIVRDAISVTECYFLGYCVICF